MDNLDLKLRLFGGRPINADGYGLIYPLKVKDIIDYGYAKYMKSLNLLCLNVEELFDEKANIDLKEFQHISVIDILIALGGEEIERELEESLSFFLKGKAIVDKENVCVLVESDGKVSPVNGSNFENIVEVIKWQNYINNFKEENKVDNNANEETKKFKERMRELQRKRDEIKKKKQSNEEDQDSQLDIYDILSSISSKSNSISEIDIMNLTVYQVYSKFKRLEAIDQYEIDIKSIMAGAKDVKLKHWSKKID